MPRSFLPICTAAVMFLHLPGSPRPARSSPPPAPSPISEDDPRQAYIRSVEELHQLYRPPQSGRRSGGGVQRKSIPEQDPGNGTGGTTGDALGWLPFTGTFDMDEAAHLLNRTVVGLRFEEIVAARDAGLPSTLDLLFAPQALPAAPGPWVAEPIPGTTGWTQAMKDSLFAAYREYGRLEKCWWTKTIAESPLSLTETMTHFWHDHFATNFTTVSFPQSMYIQNDLFRQNALGNFRDLTRAVATDPAMLFFLDGRLNRRQSPNENFARELMELFTMGEGSGYTQFDVTEAARACTGWQTDGLVSYFNASRFDTGNKTILGQTGPWGMDDVVRIIFEQDVTAEYICGKLYRWFVDDAPADEDVRALARVLRESDYEVAPVLRLMLGSAHFMGPDFHGSIIMDGVDIYAGQIRRFHITGFDPLITSPLTQRNWVLNQMTAYNHQLFDPPDVSGWPGHRNWINSYTLPNRKKYSVMIVDGLYSTNVPLGFQLDVVAETGRFSNPDDVYALVDDLSQLCFGAPPTDLVREQMVEELLQGEQPYNWNLARPDAPQRLRDLYKYVMRLPDYQLK